MRWIDALGYELRVFDTIALDRVETTPVLDVTLPAGTSSWTPPSDGCLVPGKRYAWSVRALRARGQWSDALLFEVTELPADLGAAFAVLERHLGVYARALEQVLAGTAVAPDTSDAPESARSAPNANELAEASLGGPTIAVHGEVPDPAGETYGLRGLVHSAGGAGVRAGNVAGGPDLVLDGLPRAAVTESGFSRDSALDLTFNFSNSGAGAMTLQVDGSPVVTTESDLWVNETGDTMTGLLALDPPSGFALETGSGDAIDLGGDVFKNGVRFLHDAGAINLGLGDSALNPATTGARNIAVGRQALVSNTTGSSNVAVGYRALRFNTSGSYNVSLGPFSLMDNTIGGGNVAIGSTSLVHNSTGHSNIAIGSRSLQDNTTGHGNTAVGYNALLRNTTSPGSTAVGARALRSNTTGFASTALGYKTLYSNTTGLFNTGVGTAALRDNTIGSRNTIMGSYALFDGSMADGNTALGYFSLFSNTNGDRSIALGERAGYATTGSDNILIGHAGIAVESGRIRVGLSPMESWRFKEVNCGVFGPRREGSGGASRRAEVAQGPKRRVRW